MQLVKCYETFSTNPYGLSGAKVIATGFSDLGFDVDIGPLFQVCLYDIYVLRPCLFIYKSKYFQIPSFLKVDIF